MAICLEIGETGNINLSIHQKDTLRYVTLRYVKIRYVTLIQRRCFA